MLEDVETSQPFGSFFAFSELEDLPWVETTAAAFQDAAQNQPDGPVKQALLEGASALQANDDVWSRAVEEAIYRGYGVPYPLNLS